MGSDVSARRPITNSRPPSFVSRETGAAELDFSVDTWDAMVREGKLPPPVRTGIAGTTPRWRWKDVEAALGGEVPKRVQSEEEPFFRRINNGQTKERRRGTA